MRRRVRGVAGAAVVHFAMCAIGMLLVVGWPAERSRAQTDTKEPSYQRTISDFEVEDLIAGEKLDRSDAYYCEKARDLCLGALCGSFERKNVPETCWQHCTADAYDKCLAKRE